MIYGRNVNGYREVWQRGTDLWTSLISLHSLVSEEQISDRLFSARLEGFTSQLGPPSWATKISSRG